MQVLYRSRVVWFGSVLRAHDRWPHGSGDFDSEVAFNYSISLSSFDFSHLRSLKMAADFGCLHCPESVDSSLIPGRFGSNCRSRELKRTLLASFKRRSGSWTDLIVRERALAALLGLLLEMALWQ